MVKGLLVEGGLKSKCWVEYGPFVVENVDLGGQDRVITGQSLKTLLFRGYRYNG